MSGPSESRSLERLRSSITDEIRLARRGHKSTRVSPRHAGTTTIGTGSGGGAFLEPSVGMRQPATLIIQSALTFKANATYSYKLNTKRTKVDEVVANGLTIQNGAQFDFRSIAQKRLSAGTTFTAISNTSANPISGAFANLPDGSIFTAGRNSYQVSYSGGDGNDLTLTIVP